MSTIVVRSDRMFQVWKYTVGHSLLLLRSTKCPEWPTRIDVFFKGVCEFHLPTSLAGLFITKASESEISGLCTLRKSTSFEKGVKVFKLHGRNFVGYVAALVVACHADE
jgi:hypothetical protein